MDIHFLDNMDIADITSELRDPAKYHGYLRTMAHFSSYGWRNIYRIYKQMPHASKLTDFKNRRFGIDIGNINLAIRIDEKTLETIEEQADGIITSAENRFAVICKKCGLDPITLHNPPKESTPQAEPKPSIPPNQPAMSIGLPTLKYPPDSSITISDRNQYGYTRPELLPLTKNRAITFFLHGVTIYLLHKNNTEAMAHDGRRKQFHRAQRSGDCPY